MMRLSTMWNVDRTVDASGRSPVAERLLENWPHDRGSARFFRSSANFLYVFHHEGKRHFLRFADSSERNREAIEAEVHLLRWLSETGIRVAAPVRSDAGGFVDTAVTDRGTFHAVVFEGLDGAQFEIEDLDDARFRAWGAALGRLHAAMKRHPRPGLTGRSGWRDHLDAARRHLPEDVPAVQRELDELASSLAVLPADHDTFGPIHFDFELDNLVWHDRGIGALDFDDCARYWYVADVAFALRDLFDRGATLDDSSVRAFVEGYAAECRLDRELLSLVPTFSRLARLLAYARMNRALDLPPEPGHPDWLLGLTAKLRERMEAYRIALVTTER
ncbi:MAG: phosphotransferase [Chloroflexota bacterium]|nr:phosphotransferase [Chloroflexota bacterium]